MTTASETLLADVNRGYEDSSTKVDGLHAEINKLKDHVDKRFDKVDEQLDGIKGILKAIASHLGIPVTYDPESKIIRLKEHM